MPKSELFSTIAKIIDNRIHRNYRMFACNYVAYDLLENTDKFANEYTTEEKSEFEDYLNTQLGKIDIPNKDVDFLRKSILDMYANPLKNYIIANQ